MEICIFKTYDNNKIQKLKKFIFLALIFIISCRNEHELTMERGIQYYEWDMIEHAVIEFKHVTHALGAKTKKLDFSTIKLLSRAHHNLAVAYAKQEWYSEASIEAEKAFELYPSIDNKKVLELIKKKLHPALDTLNKTIP